MRRLIKNTGVVFGAINEREGALGELVVNSNNTFEATASRDAALAETFRVFPTFLDESKATLARLEGFAGDTRPLVNQLKGPADDLGPTVRDLGDLAPDLEGPVPRPRPADPRRAHRRSGPREVPARRRAGVRGGARVLPRAEPDPVAGELPSGHAGRASSATAPRTSPARRASPASAATRPRSGSSTALSFDRLTRGRRASAATPTSRRTPSTACHRSGTFESFDCKPAGGELQEPDDELARPAEGLAAPALLPGAAVAVQRQALQQAREGQGAERLGAAGTGRQRAGESADR